jgi:hypothetical protein
MIEKTIFSPVGVKTPKREKTQKWKSPHQLLVILHLLIVVGYLFIIIIVVVVVVSRSMRGAYAKSG